MRDGNNGADIDLNIKRKADMEFREVWLDGEDTSITRVSLHCCPGLLICIEDESDQIYLSGGVCGHGMRDERSKFGPVSRF